MPFREKVNLEKEREEVWELGDEFDAYPGAQRLYQENPEEFNRIFQREKKQRRKWKKFKNPWEQEEETI